MNGRQNVWMAGIDILLLHQQQQQPVVVGGGDRPAATSLDIQKNFFSLPDIFASKKYFSCAAAFASLHSLKVPSRPDLKRLY